MPTMTWTLAPIDPTDENRARLMPDGSPAIFDSIDDAIAAWDALPASAPPAHLIGHRHYRIWYQVQRGSFAGQWVDHGIVIGDDARDSEIAAFTSLGSPARGEPL